MDQGLPTGLAARLERQCFAVAARNTMLSIELRSLLRAFEDQRVPCAPLRGLELAERLYGDFTLRPVGDLDLLVRKDDLPRAAAILRGLGFREMDQRSGFAEAFSYALAFFKEGHRWILTDLHWTITYRPFVDRVDMDQVWKRCVRGRVVGVETWRLAREELLLHLCLHLMHREGTAPLLWFYEVDRLLRQEREAFDWSRLLSFAQAAGLEFALSRVLGQRLARLLGAPGVTSREEVPFSSPFRGSA